MKLTASPPKKMVAKAKKKLLSFRGGRKLLGFKECNWRMPRAANPAPAPTVPTLQPRYAEVSNGMASNRQGHGWVNFKGLLNVDGLEEWKLLSKLGWIGIIIYQLNIMI